MYANIRDGWQDALSAAYPAPHSFARIALGPAFRARTYLRALHLLLMFPLGVAYFVTLVTLLALGFALIWTWFGPVVLLVALYLSRWAGDLEAWLVRQVAGIELRRPPTAIDRSGGYRAQIKERLVDPTSWTGLVYLFVQFGIGIGTFVAVVTMTAVAGAFIASPLVLAAFSEADLDLGFAIIDQPREAIVLVPVGIAVLWLETHLVTLFSVVHAVWARVMLGSRAPHIVPPPVKEERAPSPLTPVLEGASPAAGGAALGSAADARLAALTPRELDVLRLIARGYSNAEIAETFVISEGTVKTHVKRVFAKLEVNDRTRAAVLAYDAGLVAPQPLEVAGGAEDAAVASIVPLRGRR